MRFEKLPARLGPVLLLALASQASASLNPGTAAPGFTAPATLAGQPFTFALTEELKKGPVVVYFYPKAFTSGCTAEAHAFAAASDDFKAQGAQVIGISSDDMETLGKFSTSECGGKFPVASDPELRISKSYDATLFLYPGHSDRTSYLVTPDGRIFAEYSALNPAKHVQKMLDALRDWRMKQPASPATSGTP